MLRSYLNQQQMPNRTCIVIYDKKVSRLQKKYLKMKKLYSATTKVKNRNDIRIIGTDEFRFTSVDMSEAQVEEEAPVVKKPKKEKRKKRE
jgi:hypothetical protein